MLQKYFKNRNKLKVVVLMAFYGILGGYLLSLKWYLFNILGAICILLDIFIEFIFLSKMDPKPLFAKNRKTINDVKKTVNKSITGLRLDLASNSELLKDMKIKVLTPFTTNYIAGLSSSTLPSSLGWGVSRYISDGQSHEQRIIQLEKQIRNLNRKVEDKLNSFRPYGGGFY